MIDYDKLWPPLPKGAQIRKLAKCEVITLFILDFGASRVFTIFFN